MARRKLNKQQKSRLEKEWQSHWVRGQIIARYGKTLELELELEPELEQKVRKVQIPAKFQGNNPIEDLTVGDWVWIDPDTQLIESREERKTALIRVRRHANINTKNAYKKEDDLLAHGKIVAANISQLCIVIAPVPFIERLTLDEYLLAAQVQNIEPCIIANKNDRPEAKIQDYEDYLQEYESLGLKVIRTSIETQQGQAELHAHLKLHTSVFMGTSGVGKSSLLNMLIGDERAATGVISEQAALGKHTTTTARLYKLPYGGKLIDSPGIREFKISIVSPQDLFMTYQDLYAGEQCQYNNCTHREEPGCKVKKAVALGKALKWRYENYCQLYTTLVEGE